MRDVELQGHIEILKSFIFYGDLKKNQSSNPWKYLFPQTFLHV